jgi:hypothetical protein
MKNTYPVFLFLLFLCASCKNNDKAAVQEEPENSVDAARDFVRSALDGKFREARAYLLEDSVNTNYMDVAERSYQKASQDVKDGYRTSTIYIHKVDSINDNTSIVIYSNSYKNDHDTLKLLKVNNQWLVDIKYLYEHDRDSLSGMPLPKDTVQ